MKQILSAVSYWHKKNIVHRLNLLEILNPKILFYNKILF